jgi:hypothetical protein
MVLLVVMNAQSPFFCHLTIGSIEFASILHPTRDATLGEKEDCPSFERQPRFIRQRHACHERDFQSRARN